MWLSSVNCSPTMHVFDRRAKLLQRERAAANRDVEKFDFLKEEVGDLILFSLEEETTVPFRLVIGWQTECLTWQGEWRWRSTLAVAGAGSQGTSCQSRWADSQQSNSVLGCWQRLLIQRVSPWRGLQWILMVLNYLSLTTPLTWSHLVSQCIGSTTCQGCSGKSKESSSPMACS